MEEGRLKQRLVGAVVLIALAVIFIPMLLSGGREMEMPVFGSNVPERSTEITGIKHIDIKEMQKTEHAPVNPKRIPIAKGMPEPEIVKEKNTRSIAEKIASLTEPAKKEKQSLIKQTVWAVQVGSFKKRSNALGLKEKLRKKKMPAFVERIMKKNNQAVYRVRVGPEITRKKAVALKQKLKKEMQLTGLVVKHP